MITSKMFVFILSLFVSLNVFPASVDFGLCKTCRNPLFGTDQIHEVMRMKSFGLKDNQKALLLDYDQNQIYLFVIRNDEIQVLDMFQTSGGSGGISNKEKSGGTPPGIHKIYMKQGDNFELGQTFDARKYGYRETVIIPTQDFSVWRSKFITTRIIRLQGIEGEKNDNSVSRGILIHGTPEEGLLGYDYSGGCIRMRGEDLVHLYNQVSVGTLVNIFSKTNKPKFAMNTIFYDESRDPRLVKLNPKQP